MATTFSATSKAALAAGSKSDFVRGSIAKYGDDLTTGLNQVFTPALREGQQLPDWNQFQILGSQLLEDWVARVHQDDRRRSVALVEKNTLRARGDRVARSVRAKIGSVRKEVAAVYGEEALAPTLLGDACEAEPQALLNQVRNIQARLRDPELVLPEPIHGSDHVDPVALAASMDGGVNLLAASVAGLVELRKRGDKALFAKHEALERLNHYYVNVARCLDGLYSAAGRPSPCLTSAASCYDVLMKLPYGNADYHRLITHGFAYVDRTRYIREVEELGENLLFVRPRRFGKSLWLSTLANWYDLRTADEHEALFGGRDAEKDEHRPATAHNYFVLNWNFSNVGTRGTRGPGNVDQLARDLDDYVLATLAAFVLRYRDHLPMPVDVEGSPIRVLTMLLAVIRESDHPLMLLIDEYDNFANDVMMADPESYKQLVLVDGPFKQLMKWVKAASEGLGLERMFLTGVTPVVLSDVTSGLNIAKNVSLESEVNALAGFTEAEIEGLLEEVVAARRAAEKPTELPVDEALDVLRTWYNGYRFSPDAEDLVYNPTLTLYFLDHFLRKGKYPRQMLDANLAADEGKRRARRRWSTWSGPAGRSRSARLPIASPWPRCWSTPREIRRTWRPSSTTSAC
jgi:hypothetical protein